MSDMTVSRILQVYIKNVSDLVVLAERQNFLSQTANLVERQKFKSADRQRLTHCISVQVVRVQVHYIFRRFGLIVVGQVFVVGLGITVADCRNASAYTAFD